jgi:hypothetical protein
LANACKLDEKKKKWYGKLIYKAGSRNQIRAGMALQLFKTKQPLPIYESGCCLYR